MQISLQRINYQVIVTLGHGKMVGISAAGFLEIANSDYYPTSDFGPATKKQIQVVIDALEKLKIHAEE